MENTRQEFGALKANGEYNSLPNHCQNCESTENLQIHHIVPLAVGGTNRVSNMARLCGTCHDLIHGGDALKSLQSVDTKNRGRIPYGYYKVRNEVIQEPERAKVVKAIFEMRFIEKYTLTAIAEALDRCNVQTALGGKWSSQYIGSRILTQELYFNANERITSPIMDKKSFISWELVQEHNALDKGKKKRIYFENSSEIAYKLMKRKLN